MPFIQSEYYPLAKWTPLVNHSAPGLLFKKKLIVCHITQGSTAAGAIEHFKQTVSPNRTSAHFVIDRDSDATIYQLLPISDIAWHASEVNGISVGIEHVAVAPGTYPKLPFGQLPTDAQYQASAALIRWLCGKMGILVERKYIQGHNECSPKDGHVGCCTPTLDLDQLVKIARNLGELG